MAIDDQKLDGNAAGGLLAQIFAVEMTTAQVTCAGCGNSLPMANTAVYATAMGTIIRCPGCDVALVRIVAGPQRYWIDVSGLRMIQLPVS